LDHLHVTITPLLNAFVEIHEALAHLPGVGVIAVDVEQHALKRFILRYRLCDVALQLCHRHRVAMAGEVVQERIPYGAPGEALLEPCPSVGARRIVIDGAAALLAESELDAAELIRLESAA